MEDQGPPQIQNEALGIKDKDQSTEGGPPGWVAFAIVAGIFLAAGAVVFALVYFL